MMGGIVSEMKRRIGRERPASIAIQEDRRWWSWGGSWDTHFGRQPVTLSAWCYNLFDKDYWYAAGGNNIGLGAPRTYAISAQFKF